MDKSFLPHLPSTPGVYLMRNAKGDIIYIGKARNLKRRVASYFNRQHGSYDSHDSKIQALVSEVRHVDYLNAASEREALVLERRFINKFSPFFNAMWKDDKSYPYLALTIQEDFPRLILTRRKKRDGALYYGPYPNVYKVRQLLRWIWKKKFFPLRPCTYDFSEHNLLPYEKVKSCLYLHTKECPAPCIGTISKKKYDTIVDRARWFFEGNQGKMLASWEKEMKALARQKKYEAAAQMRDRWMALQHMQEPVTVREMSVDDLSFRLGRSRSVQQLMKDLFLSKAPEVIECFDISHFQGEEKVASMVQFKHGRPNKSNYRKFIIKTVDGIDDFKAMAEVVGRRYRRLKNEKKPMPDLILVDGGKGQLSAAQAVLKKENLGHVALASLAKREEEIFIPGQSQPIILESSSEALKLLQHIRDEAHRFAITFHRKRRLKRSFDKK